MEEIKPAVAKSVAIGNEHRRQQRPLLVTNDAHVYAQELVAKYSKQLIHGCDDPNCSSVYCARSIKAHGLAGRQLGPSAVHKLAQQLAAAWGDQALCRSIRKEQGTARRSARRASDVTALKGSGSRNTSGLKTFAALLKGMVDAARLSSAATEFIHNMLAQKQHVLTRSLHELYTTLLGLISGEWQRRTASSEIASVIHNADPEGLTYYLAHFAQGSLAAATDSTTASSILECIGALLNRFPLMEPPSIRWLSRAIPINTQVRETSERQFASLWPQNLPYSAVMNSPIGLETDQAQVDMAVPFTGYFRRYQHGKSPLYLTNHYRLLPNYRQIALFRYGCLKQMMSSRDRVKKLEQVVARAHGLVSVPQDVEAMIANYAPALANMSCFVMELDQSDRLDSALKSISDAMMIGGLVKRPLRVRFQGSEFVATDLGGVQAEMFRDLGQHLVESGFFVETEAKTIWFNSGYTGSVENFKHLGILLGIGVYNGCILGCEFGELFYRLLRDPTNRLEITLVDDIADMYPDWAKQLASLTTGSLNVDSLGLHFEFDYRDDQGEYQTVKLPSFDDYLNGAVTNQNVGEYITELVHYRFEKSIEPFVSAFLQGFKHVLHQDLINILQPSTLKLLVEGTHAIDIDEWERETRYEDYTWESRPVRLFWEVVRQFSTLQCQMLLMFVTGSHRVPIGGLSKLEFTIKRIRHESINPLPSSQTCFATLNLPEYEDATVLKRCLEKALEHTSGFGLV